MWLSKREVSFIFGLLLPVFLFVFRYDSFQLPVEKKNSFLMTDKFYKIDCPYYNMS